MEYSMPWAGTTVGDASFAPYSDDEWSDSWNLLFNVDRATRCVIRGYLNELIVSASGGGNVEVASGAALVDGKVYTNSAAITIAIATPGATRVDRIVLRKDFVAQTVRAVRIAGTEGGAEAALTQVDGVTWEVPLAKISITSGGVITITDERIYVLSPLTGGEGYGYFYIPATAGSPAITGGCSSVAQGELGTNDIDIMYLGFPNAAISYAVFPGVRMPDDWDGGVVYASFDWTHPAATAFKVMWGLTGICYANDAAMDAAYGTPQEIFDTGGTTNDYYQSAETPALTLGGTPAGGNYAIFRAYRDPVDADDTLDAEARLLGILIRYRRG